MKMARAEGRGCLARGARKVGAVCAKAIRPLGRLAFNHFAGIFRLLGCFCRNRVNRLILNFATFGGFYGWIL
jgi:hypothetical protein